MFGRGIPSLCVGLRGLMYLEVRVDGPRADLHSGSFGGGVTNPVNALAQDDCEAPRRRRADRGAGLLRQRRRRSRRPSATEIASLPFDEKEWLASTGSPPLFGEKGYSTLERVWARPTLDCNGIDGGFQGEGAKTIIPARARAKISCRLVPHQEPEEIERKVGEYLKRSRRRACA